MKQLSILCLIFSSLILASCASNEEPEYPFIMQPDSIQTIDANGDNQTFEYDDFGRIVSWSCSSNSTNLSSSYSSYYSYPDENTIKVTAEEFGPSQHRIFEETIQLKNGRASESEGTFIAVMHTNKGTSQLRKTYRLIFDYLPTNHLNAVEHIEVRGIGDDIEDNDWNNAWRWMNYLIWDNGNLKEYQDYQGKTTSYLSTKYEYSEDKVSYPVIIPMVINNAHHLPLYMQGVFGLYSVNLVKSASSFDNNANLTFARQYSYEFDNDRISKYTETLFTNLVIYNPITYTVTWTKR